MGADGDTRDRRSRVRQGGRAAGLGGRAAGRTPAGAAGLGRGAVLAAGLAAAVLAIVAPASAAAASAWSDYDRPAEFAVTSDPNVPIEMRDGVVLRANVDRPAAAGEFPTLIVQTPYNKDAGINTFLGGATRYFVERGYAVVTVDVRGTGSSEGEWDSFGPKEQRDGAEVVAWARRQPWSDGKVGLWGPSYMAITQLYTAAQRPPGLKAIFPIVPMGDGYRDIVFAGGQVNVSFIPLWLGLVTAGGLTPSPNALDPSDPLGSLGSALGALASHIAGAVNFQAQTVLDATTGGTTAYDGPFWKKRSPLEVVDRIEVPAFVTGGHHDLFQRGEPLIYERLKRRVPARLLMGPWTHVGGSTGEGLPRDGVPSLNSIALRWFDRWLLQRKRATRIGRIPAVTQYVFGRERYRTFRDWPDPRTKPERRYLRGAGALARKPAQRREQPQTFLQQPLSGVCTQSTVQWTAGLGEAIPCTRDNRFDELGSAVYMTPPAKRPLRLLGPALADLWVRTSARDAVLTVRLSDVAPDGTPTELTSGWLAASFRALDRARSRFVRGRLLQPWHPFTEASLRPVEPGEAVRMRVEIFPTAAVIKPGHRLKLTVGPADFPHQVPPLPQLANSLGGRVEILTGPRHPSSITTPGLRRCKPSDPCRPLPVAKLVRGRG